MNEFTHTCWSMTDALEKSKRRKKQVQKGGNRSTQLQKVCIFLERPTLVSCKSEHNTTRPQVRCFLHAAFFFLVRGEVAVVLIPVRLLLLPVVFSEQTCSNSYLSKGQVFIDWQQWNAWEADKLQKMLVPVKPQTKDSSSPFNI